ANADGIGVEVQKGDRTLEYIADRLIDAGMETLPDANELLIARANLGREKWDWALSRPLLYANYASLYLNLDEAMDWLHRLNCE
ncbi:MAG: DEAD/DEAH box helicase, partial [Gammaproteobacteria bacterium]|nr:DEAD/DEAH box helicase [Gammaproteobacteria bacterium]